MATTSLTYIFALVMPGQEKLLKEEVLLRAPHCKFSFSTSGFLTFKCEGIIPNLYFCWQQGIVEKKLLPSEVATYLTKDTLCWRKSHSLIAPWGIDQENQKTIHCNQVILMTAEDQFWLGRINRYKSSHWGEPSISFPREAPSRAYLKIAETDFLYSLQLAQSRVIELGSAPGGCSYYLLEKGATVIGVDPGKMDSLVYNHKNYKHIASPLEKCERSIFPSEFDFLLCDINLSPSIIYKEIKRIFEISPPQKGLIITLKMTDLKHLSTIYKFTNLFKEWGISDIQVKHLYSHKQELLLIALK